jgi:hypothetical protein
MVALFATRSAPSGLPSSRAPCVKVGVSRCQAVKANFHRATLVASRPVAPRAAFFSARKDLRVRQCQQQTLEEGEWREGGILRAVIPDIGRELPVDSDLLPHHDTLAGTSCGVGALVLRIFARCGAMRSSGERSARLRLCRARDESSLHRWRDAVAADRDGGRFERAVLLLVGG